MTTTDNLPWGRSEGSLLGYPQTVVLLRATTLETDTDGFRDPSTRLRVALGSPHRGQIDAQGVHE